MDGKTVARMRLLERSNAELSTQNTYLSDQVLRMSEAVDGAARQSHIDRLLTAALIEFAIGPDGGVIELPVADVDDLKRRIAEPPGLSVDLAKDDDRQVWLVRIAPNEADPSAAAEEPARPSLIVLP